MVVPIFALVPVVVKVATKTVRFVLYGTVTEIFVPVKVVCKDVRKLNDVVSFPLFEATVTVTVGVFYLRFAGLGGISQKLILSYLHS